MCCVSHGLFRYYLVFIETLQFKLTKIMLRDFLVFLNEYKVVSLAVGFVMGAASTNVINSLVKDILMPIVTPLMASESWRTATLDLGQISIAYGSFLAELLNFLILALIIFIVAKKIIKEEKEETK